MLNMKLKFTETLCNKAQQLQEALKLENYTMMCILGVPHGWTIDWLEISYQAGIQLQEEKYN